VSKRRITTEIIASGQPRPYADSIGHARVSFEWQGMEGFSNKEAPFVPNYMSEEAARRILPGLQAGFTAKTAKECEWYETRLDWLRPVDGKPASETLPGGSPTQTVASVWEFHTTSPYTD
jgi:hypothetical protein